ncbi:MAG: hypothetical protein WEC75_02525 [Dehalococcoidia bacterium]
MDFYNGPSRSDIPLVFKVSLLDSFGNVLKASVLSNDGRLSERIAVSTSETSASYTLDVLFADAETGDDVLRAWTEIRGLTRPVRPRIELTATPTSPVLINANVSLVVSVAGDGMAGTLVQLSVSGGGVLDGPTARLTSSGGQVVFGYTAPSTEAFVDIVASVTGPEGSRSTSLTLQVVRPFFGGSFLDTRTDCGPPAEGPVCVVTENIAMYIAFQGAGEHVGKYALLFYPQFSCSGRPYIYLVTVAPDGQTFTGNLFGCQSGPVSPERQLAEPVSGSLLGDELRIEFRYVYPNDPRISASTGSYVGQRVVP